MDVHSILLEFVKSNSHNSLCSCLLRTRHRAGVASFKILPQKSSVFRKKNLLMRTRSCCFFHNILKFSRDSQKTKFCSVQRITERITNYNHVLFNCLTYTVNKYIYVFYNKINENFEVITQFLMFFISKTFENNLKTKTGSPNKHKAFFIIPNSPDTEAGINLI